jgi:hypothetical protein
MHKEAESVNITDLGTHKQPELGRRWPSGGPECRSCHTVGASHTGGKTDNTNDKSRSLYGARLRKWCSCDDG